MSVPATECPRIPAEHLEQERQEMGEDWVRQEYLCEFVDIGGTVFVRDLVEAAFTSDIPVLGASSGPRPICETFVAVDLGQKHDFTAIAMLERHQDRPHFLATRRASTSYRLRHIERIPLGTPYPRIVDRIAALTHHPEIEGRCTVVADATGAGVPVIDMLRQALDCHLMAVTITGGEIVHRSRTSSTVPKRDLILSLELLLEDGELRIAAGLSERRRLVEEMMSLRAGHTASGHDTYGASAHNHDDLVLALSLGCWAARKPEIGHQEHRLL